MIKSQKIVPETSLFVIRIRSSLKPTCQLEDQTNNSISLDLSIHYHRFNQIRFTQIFHLFFYFLPLEQCEEDSQSRSSHSASHTNVLLVKKIRQISDNYLFNQSKRTGDNWIFESFEYISEDSQVTTNQMPTCVIKRVNKDTLSFNDGCLFHICTDIVRLWLHNINEDPPQGNFILLLTSLMHKIN